MWNKHAKNKAIKTAGIYKTSDNDSYLLLFAKINDKVLKFHIYE